MVGAAGAEEEPAEKNVGKEKGGGHGGDVPAHEAVDGDAVRGGVGRHPPPFQHNDLSLGVPFTHHVDEVAMDAAVGGELGMEGGGEQMALADEDRKTVALGEDLNFATDLLNARRADVDH